MRKLITLFAITLFFTEANSQALRVMPLGNSITQAESNRLSYRYNLWVKLKAANTAVDFVGSLNTNFLGSPGYADPTFDRDHEGHWGWRADELLAGLPQWLNGYTPDVVLMHAGSNDVFQGATTASTVLDLKGIIDVIRNENPNVTILLAKLIGSTTSSNVGIIALNSQMDAIVLEKNTSLSRVIIVDQYSGFNPASDTYDGVHPNALGEEKMAQKWFDAIQQLSSPTATGLRGEYFNNSSLNSPSVLTRTDQQINFDWGNGSPVPGISSDNFSVRWTGQVEAPITGNITFSTVSDDGIRLWINNVQIINHWGTHAPTTDFAGPIALTAGVKYDIRLEYFENLIGAVARLQWSYSGVSQQIIPQSRLSLPTSSETDISPPSIPSGLVSTNVGETSFTLSWNASTDDVGVATYEVLNNGVAIGTTAALSLNVSNLSPATSYSMTVRARDVAINWSGPSSGLIVTTAASSGTSGAGLRAEYFNNTALTGSAVITKIDPQVNFDWGTGSPVAGINNENFSVRWTGQVQSAISGNITFSTVSDDGVRLWINNVQVINNWGTHAPTTDFSVPITLTAGVKYALRLEYFESQIGAVARLQWSYPGQAQQVIPQLRLFPGDLDVTAPTIPAGLTSSNITETSFNLSWNASSDAVGVTGYEIFNNGVAAGTASTNTFTLAAGLLPATSNSMTVRARDAAGNFSAQSSPLIVTTPGVPGGTSGMGLKAEYFNNINLAAPIALTRIDPQVNFDWAVGAPALSISNDNFSVRWSGLVESPVSGNVIFSTVSDDGVRLWINNVQVINNWGTHAPITDYTVPIALSAGVKYPVRMEYFEGSIGAVARLLWSYPGQLQQAIPQVRLFLETTSAASAFLDHTVVQNTDAFRSDFASTINLYPNPLTQGDLKLEIFSADEHPCSIEIYANDSRKIFTTRVSLVKGDNVITIPLNEFAEGLNLVFVRKRGMHASKKVFVSQNR